MSLRLRFTLIVSALLAAVLVGAGGVLAGVEADQYLAEQGRRLRYLVHATMGSFAAARRGGKRGPWWRGFPVGGGAVAEAAIPEPVDGAHVEIHYFLDGREGAPRSILRATTSTFRIPEAVAGVRAADAWGGAPREAEIDDQTWLYVIEPLGPGPGPGRGRWSPPGGPGPPPGLPEEPPPGRRGGPPPGPPRLVAVAFIDRATAVAPVGG
ncbi:MAG: hypothetical protein ACC662_00655, partial [Planctomycetota bacterium]